jgi:opacity protein-like surface antigen
MQVWRSRGNLGMWVVAASLAAALALGAVGTALAEESAPGSGNMVVFRGGYIHLDSGRGNELWTDARNPLGAGLNDSQNGWYIGAWLDMLLSKDAWGMINDTAVLGEIGIQFNRITSQVVTNTDNLGIGPTGAGPGLVVTSTTPSLQQLTMATISIAPKIRFMQSSRLSPWIIPVGLDLHVFSPPSNGTQYLDVGVQFGAGVDYAVWKAFKVGLDARYHLAANMTNSTTNNYMQVGPYVGISF